MGLRSPRRGEILPVAPPPKAQPQARETTSEEDKSGSGSRTTAVPTAPRRPAPRISTPDQDLEPDGWTPEGLPWVGRSLCVEGGEPV